MSLIWKSWFRPMLMVYLSQWQIQPLLTHLQSLFLLIRYFCLPLFFLFGVCLLWIFKIFFLFTTLFIYCFIPQTTSSKITFRVSIIIFLCTIFSIIGFVLLIVFGGIGLVALPFDLIYEYKHRPKRISLQAYWYPLYYYFFNAFNNLFNQGLKLERKKLTNDVVRWLLLARNWKTQEEMLVSEMWNIAAMSLDSNRLFNEFIK